MNLQTLEWDVRVVALQYSVSVDKRGEGKQIKWICQTKTNWSDKLGSPPLPHAYDCPGLLFHWSSIGRA